MEKLEKELKKYVDRIAKEVKKKFNKSTKWKDDLSSAIKETIDKISKEYALDDKKKNELLSSFTHKAAERISESRSRKYLKLNRDMLNTTENKVAFVLGDESFYTLNEKEIIELLTEDFFSPLIDQLKLAKFKGGHLTEDKIILYRKIFKRFDLEKQNDHNPKWTAVFNWESNYKDERGNPLISDEQDRNRQRKTFCNFRSKYKLNSAKDFEEYLTSNNYIQE